MVILTYMKTAISIPDHLFKKVEKTARKMGLTRSRFFTIAVEEFIENHTPSQVTDKLNAIYENEKSEIDQNFYTMQVQSLEKEVW